MVKPFDRELHARYFLKNLTSLPAPYASQDVHRVVLVRSESFTVAESV